MLVQSDVLLKEREGTLKTRIKVQPSVDPFHKFQEGTAASLSTSEQFNIWITLDPIAIGFPMGFNWWFVLLVIGLGDLGNTTLT